MCVCAWFGRGFNWKRKACLHQVRVHTLDSKLCMTSRDLGVGNGTSPQLAPDNDRMLENMPVALHNADTDKVKQNYCSNL